MGMRATAAVREQLRTEFFRSLPDDQYFEIDQDGHWSFQCETQADVRALRRALQQHVKHHTWRKAFYAGAKWWEYFNEKLDGKPIKVYACREAPEQCRAITETVEVEERVPVEFETRTVTREVTRWECPEDVGVEDMA